MPDYFVCNPSEEVPEGNYPLVLGETLVTGIVDFGQRFENPTSLESDLLTLAAAVFAADRASQRGEREDINRTIRISIPVVNAGLLIPRAKRISRVLRRLSSDLWELEFRPVAGDPETNVDVETSGGSTLLFSGGLDSLAGAIDYRSRQEPLDLVTHNTKNPSLTSAQNQLIEALSANGITPGHYRYLVTSKSDPDDGIVHNVEVSQRTRSFVFMTIGALTARRTGNLKMLLMAENGQLAIHLPLTRGRIGAFSTHTAHPRVISTFADLLSEMLGAEISIYNPYVHKTKAEVVEIVASLDPALIPITISCWRGSRVLGDANHCGECIPCFIRKIAIESNCEDETRYKRNVWNENLGAMGPDDEARRNMADLLEFNHRISSYVAARIMSEWPELNYPEVDGPAVIEMYKKAAMEADQVFASYPSVQEFSYADD